MKTYLLNVTWLIMVSLLTINTYSQININPTNNVEISISCDELINLTPPTITTNCEGDVEYTFEDKTYSGGCMGTIERIWTIRDKCNNTESFQQFIRLSDSTAPELSSYPSDISVSNNQIPDVPIVNAEDNCSQNLSVAFSVDSVLDNDGNLISIHRTWFVKDKCGNEKTHTQIISIQKNES